MSRRSLITLLGAAALVSAPAQAAPTQPDGSVKRMVVADTGAVSLAMGQRRFGAGSQAFLVWRDLGDLVIYDAGKAQATPPRSAARPQADAPASEGASLFAARRDFAEHLMRAGQGRERFASRLGAGQNLAVNSMITDTTLSSDIALAGLGRPRVGGGILGASSADPVNTAAVDAVSGNPVLANPVPGAAVLMLTALGGLAAARRRKA